MKPNWCKISHNGYFSGCVMLLSMLFVLTGCTAENKFEKEVAIETSAITLTREVLRGKYKIINTKELKEHLDTNPDTLLIDSMPYDSSYKKNHIPHAKQFLFPIPEMNEWNTGETDGKTTEDFVTMLGDDKNKMIVIYCGFVKCTRSHNGAMWAVKLGYTNIHRYPGGIFAWKGAKYPLNAVE